MANGIDIRIDTQPFVEGLREFSRQVPFAVSFAMNQTGKDALAYMRSDVQRIFTIRTNLDRLGINAKWSTKHDLSLVLGSEFNISALQVLGGMKTGKGGHDVAVPMVGPGSPRPTITSMTRPSKWPKAQLAESTGTFIGNAKTKKGEVRGVWRRVYRDAVTGKIVGGSVRDVRRASDLKTRASILVTGKEHRIRRGLKLLYELLPSVHIDARWPMREQVEHVFAGRFPVHAQEAIEYAIKTSHEKSKRAHVAGMRYGVGSNQHAGRLVPGRF